MFATNVILTVKNENDCDKISELLRELGRLSREEPGCQSYEVCWSQSDRRVFLLIERWETKSAWEAHREAPPYQTIYQPQVLPLVDRVPHPSDLLD